LAPIRRHPAGCDLAQLKRERARFLKKEAIAKARSRVKGEIWDLTPSFYRLGRPNYGILKNLRENPCKTAVSLNGDPYRQYGILLVNRDLTAFAGRKSKIRSREGSFDLRPIREKGRVYKLCILGNRVCLKPCGNYRKAYEHNLRFIFANRFSHARIKRIAHVITRTGISVRNFKKLRMAARLFYIGRSRRAFKIYTALSAALYLFEKHSNLLSEEPVEPDSRQALVSTSFSDDF